MLALFSSEQNMLRDLVSDLIAPAQIDSPADLRTVDRAATWRALANADLLGLRQRDGSDPESTPAASGVETLIVCERLAYGLTPAPYLGTSVLALDLLARADAPADLIADISSGNARYGIAFTTDLTSPAVAGEGDCIVFDCDGADYVLFCAPGAELGRRSSANLIDSDGADLTRRVARLSCGNADPIAPPPGNTAYQSWLALGLTALAADMVGTMRGALDKAVEYTKVRVQFGALIGTFQAVQHLCAQAYVQVEAAWSLAKYAAWAVDELEPAESLAAARTANAYASQVTRGVVETVMQVYGGIGQTWECSAHLYLRRGLLDRAVLGDERAQLDALADLRLGPIG